MNSIGKRTRGDKTRKSLILSASKYANDKPKSFYLTLVNSSLRCISFEPFFVSIPLANSKGGFLSTSSENKALKREKL